MVINDKQNQLLKRLSRELKLKLVVLYGSKAGGITNQESDLDLAVLTEAKPDLKLFNRLYHFLSEIFQEEAVDVRFLNDADPLFLMQVAKDGRLLAGKRENFIELKIQANRRYIDDGRKYFAYQDQLIKRQQQYLARASL